MKKFLSKLVMIALIFTLSIGISSVAYAYDDADIIAVNEQYLNSWNSTDFNQYLEDETIDANSVDQFTKWQAVKDQLGAFTSIDATQVNEADGVITAVTTATYENSKLTFTITYDSQTVETSGAMYGIASIDATVDSTSKSPNMAKAGMNTLMGMGTVFVVLILISLVISALKYVPGLFEKKKSVNNTSEQVSHTVDHVVSTIEKKEENLMGDSELVAVITAAIMASEVGNVAPGGLVVRSIRRKR
ncbi:MAG: OadG family transporter subunit [Velocimicrobium sp.]